MARKPTAAELAELNAPPKTVPVGGEVPGAKTRPPTPAEAAELNPPEDHSGFFDPQASLEQFTGNAKAAADSASLGLLPRAIAAGDTLAQTIDPRGPKAKDAWETYKENLSKQQAASFENARKHPSASIVGGYLTPGIGAVASKLTPLQRVAGAGVVGGLAGNLQAPHDDPDARVRGGLVGGGTAMATQGINEGLGPVLDYGSNLLRKFSGQNAANVMGGGRGQIGDRMAKVGIAPEDQADFGNRALDKGLIPTGLNPLESPVEGVLSATNKLRQSSGNQIGEALQAADATGVPFDPLTAQMNVRAKMRPETPMQEAKSAKANELVEMIGNLGRFPDGTTFKRANQQKSEAWEGFDSSDHVPMEKSRYQKANGLLRDEIQNQASDAAGDDVGTQLARGNSDYGFASTVKELAAPAVSRGGQEMKFKNAAAALVDPSAAAALAAGGILKSRGPAALAHLQRIGSDWSKAAGAHVSNPLAAGAVGGAASELIEAEDEGSKLKKRFSR